MLKIFNGIKEWQGVKNAAVTIGSYDGVHLAHRSLIQQLNEYATLDKGESVLISFFPHPRMVLNAEDNFRKNFRLLTTQDEKHELLEEAGLQNILNIHFDEEFSHMSAEDFVKTIIVDAIHAKRVLVGFNHNFGHDREGGFDKMSELGDRYGFIVQKYSEILVEQEKVSSSQIRRFLQAGNIEEANHLLGYRYFINGVWKDDLFLPYHAYKLIPAAGTYLTKIRSNAAYHYAVCEVKDKIYFPDMLNLQDGEELKVAFIKPLKL